jgi:hypothetical protein
MRLIPRHYNAIIQQTHNKFRWLWLCKVHGCAAAQGNAQANSFAHCRGLFRGNGQIAYHSVFTRNLKPGGFRTASNPYKNSFRPVNQATKLPNNIIVKAPSRLPLVYKVSELAHELQLPERTLRDLIDIGAPHQRDQSNPSG